MRVFVLTYAYAYEGSEVEGVYESLEEAQQAADKNPCSPDGWAIQECVVGGSIVREWGRRRGEMKWS